MFLFPENEYLCVIAILFIGSTIPSTVKKELLVHLLNQPPDQVRRIKYQMEVALLACAHHIVVVKPLAHPFAMCLADLPDVVSLPAAQFKPERGNLMWEARFWKAPHNI